MSEESNAGKYLAGLGAAGAIGAGLLFFGGDGEIDDSVYTEDFPEAVVEVIDDIKPYYIPTDLYAVEKLSLDKFKVDVPEIKSLSPDKVEVLTLAIDGIDIEVLSPELVKILVLAIDGIDIEVLSPETIKVVVEVVNSFESNGVKIDDLSPDVVKIIILTVESLDGDVPKIQALKRLLSDIIYDKRMIQHDRSLTINNKVLSDWLEIYASPLPSAINFIPLPRNIRMIAELRSLDYATENLSYYRRIGYNACLVSLDGSESVQEAIALVEAVKGVGLRAWFVFGGEETLNSTIFRDIKHLKNLINAVAPMCSGYLTAWRRTSAHLVAQDAKYIEYLAFEVRKANSKIYIVGESYYGQTFENLPHVNQEGWVARNNVVRNQSGILIAGVSTRGFAIEQMLNNQFRHWRNLNRLGLVLGEKPYYASSNSTGKSFIENLSIKQQLELRFLRAGCIGTITIHGDGSDRGSSLMSVDDIGKYKIQ